VLTRRITEGRYLEFISLGSEMRIWHIIEALGSICGFVCLGRIS
jgi:hypothetical protein